MFNHINEEFGYELDQIIHKPFILGAVAQVQSTITLMII
jgi:hypothetical protein